jgi:hypothetical protein
VKAIDPEGYQSTLQVITGAQDNDALMELNVRIQRVTAKAEMLPALFATLVKMRQQLSKLRREKPEDPSSWTKELLKTVGTVSVLEGALAMLLAIAESDQDEDAVGTLQLRLQSTLELLEKARQRELLQFPNEEEFSMEDVAAAVKGLPLKHDDVFKPKTKKLKFVQKPKPKKKSSK